MREGDGRGGGFTGSEEGERERRLQEEDCLGAVATLGKASNFPGLSVLIFKMQMRPYLRRLNKGCLLQCLACSGTVGTA